jgi:hypothetical protein
MTSWSRIQKALGSNPGTSSANWTFSLFSSDPTGERQVIWSIFWPHNPFFQRLIGLWPTLYCRFMIPRYLRPAVLTQFTYMLLTSLPSDRFNCRLLPILNFSRISIFAGVRIGVLAHAWACIASFSKTSLSVLSRSTHTSRFAPSDKFAGMRIGTYRLKTLVHVCIYTVCLSICMCLLSSNEA